MSATITRRHKRKLKADINVVPYIDVMLVLLIIFMVTAPLLSMFVIPAAWFLLQRRRARKVDQAGIHQAVPSGTKVPSIQSGEAQ